MSFQQFKQSWWPSVVCLALALVAGVRRNWDGLSLTILAGVICIAGLRLLLLSIRRLGVSNLARMSPAEREQFLRKCTQERRAQIEKDIREHHHSE